MCMEQTNDRLPLTSGLLTLPNSDTQRGFSIFVLGSSLHFEIQDGATYTYSAPVFLLDAVRTQGYDLPDAAVAAIQRFAQSGGRVIEAMVASIQTEMRAMARNSKMESAWCDHPERLIWQLVKVHVPADIQLAVFALLQPYRHYFAEDDTVVVKRGKTPHDHGI